MNWTEASNKFRLTEDQTAAVHGLQFGIQHPKIERMREKERLPQSRTEQRKHRRQTRQSETNGTEQIRLALKTAAPATEDGDRARTNRTENGAGAGTGVRAAKRKGLCAGRDCSVDRSRL